MELHKLVELISEYHREMGRPRVGTTSIKVQMKDFRDFVLAGHAELTELLDSAPWKPWREQKAEDIDLQNIRVEIVDMLFFLIGIMEIFGITADELESVFLEKLAENYRRIKDGYSKTKG